MTVSPFSIAPMSTEIFDEPSVYRNVFERQHAFVFDAAFSPALCDQIMRSAAAAEFIDDDVEYIGTRQIAASQGIGKSIALLLSRPAMLRWLEQATGQAPLRAVTGMLAQTRANGEDALHWHDDMGDDQRKLAVVVNLSDAPYIGGAFSMRRKGEGEPFFRHRFVRPGTVVIFAVDAALEHCVAPLISGGPRRVFAGWYMSETVVSGA
jgi:2OG-Fe(II) oxygenase superfamily